MSFYNPAFNSPTRQPVVEGFWMPSYQSWLDAWRIPRYADGTVHLYKATDLALCTGQDYGKRTYWHVGSEVRCTDWNPVPACGGGLHLSPTPVIAASYQGILSFEGSNAGTRYFLVEVNAADIVPIPHEYTVAAGGRWPRNKIDKCKVPRAKVLAEVTMEGVRLHPEPAEKTA